MAARPASQVHSRGYKSFQRSLAGEPKKASQAEALYMPQAMMDDSTPRGSGHGARCGKCMMAREDGKCFGVYLDADKEKPMMKRRSPVSLEHGVCGLYTPGKPHKKADGEPMPTVPRAAAGYYEGPEVPTHCGNCRNLEGHDDCRKVAGKAEGQPYEIEQYGCCNRWQHLL
ncbi:MAG: hypothetical protein L0Z53_06185 [Acidobacteriales bacterium]|nr:hypothetical protein [Terriglobales bacterium]